MSKTIATGVQLTTESYDYGVVDVLLTEYADGTPALQVRPHDFPVPETISINLSGYGMHPHDGCVFVKDYSEHQGMADGLEAAGVATRRQSVQIGFGSGWEMTLTPKA